MPDIDDDDTLSDAELDIIDLARHGEPLRIDMASAQEVERANRLLERGLMKVVGNHTEPDGATWTLIKRVEQGETAERTEPLVATTSGGAA
jgi:hypothetical protein